MALAALVDEQHLLTVLERELFHRSLGAGRNRAATKPASGVSALITSAAAGMVVGHPAENGDAEAAGADGEADDEAGGHAGVSRHVGLGEDDRHREACGEHGAEQREHHERQRSARLEEQEPERHGGEEHPLHERTRPHRSASGPASTVPSAPAPRKTNSSGPTMRGSALR